MRLCAALLCLLVSVACTPARPPAEPIIEAPVIVEEAVIVEERIDPCAAGDGDGIGGTGCPVD